jgi:hypothetical protein
MTAMLEPPAWSPAERAVRRGLADAAAGLEARLPADAESVSIAVATLADGTLAGPPDPGSVRAAVRANVAAFIGVLRRGEVPDSFRLPADALEHAQSLARRGLPLAELLRSYRIGHAETSALLLDVLRTTEVEPPHREALTVRATELLFAFVDRLTSAVIDGFLEEQRVWERSPEAVRGRAVRSLLDGRPADPAELGRVLGHDTGDGQLAVVLWTGGVPGATVRARLEDVAAAADRHLRPLLGEVAALRVGGETELWLWYAGAPAQLAAAAEALARLEPDGDAVRVTVGEPGVGLAGFRRSHQEAMLARRVVMAAADPAPGAVRYRDVAIPALLSSDLDRLGDVVRRELGVLASGDDDSARLRETLAAFYAGSGSHLRASETLGVHRNTVVYRLRRCEELLGRPVTERRLPLELALHLVDVFGIGLAAGTDERPVAAATARL